jgi:acyl dehydratase
MSLRWEDLSESTELPPRSLGAVTRTDVVRYQGASGDMNPIHHDEPFATSAGYPAPLVVGMYQAGALLAWAAGLLGPENVRRTRVRWKEQVWPGDELLLTGKVARRYEEDGARKVDLELFCKRQGGGVAVEAWATFVVP